MPTNKRSNKIFNSTKKDLYQAIQTSALPLALNILLQHLDYLQPMTPDFLYCLFSKKNEFFLFLLRQNQSSLIRTMCENDLFLSYICGEAVVLFMKNEAETTTWQLTSEEVMNHFLIASSYRYVRILHAIWGEEGSPLRCFAKTTTPDNLEKIIFAVTASDTKAPTSFIINFLNTIDDIGLLERCMKKKENNAIKSSGYVSRYQRQQINALMSRVRILKRMSSIWTEENDAEFNQFFSLAQHDEALQEYSFFSEANFNTSVGILFAHDHSSFPDKYDEDTISISDVDDFHELMTMDIVSGDIDYQSPHDEGSQGMQNNFTIQDLVSLCMFESEDNMSKQCDDVTFDANHVVRNSSLMPT